MREPSDQIKIGNYSYTYAYNVNGHRFSIAEASYLFNRFYTETSNEPQQQEIRKSPYSLYPDDPKTKKSSQEHYAPEVTKAIDGINYVCEHLKKEDLEKMVIYQKLFKIYSSFELIYCEELFKIIF